MSCGCAERMRGILKMRGFRLESGSWWKDGSQYYEDADLEYHHLEILRRWFLGEAAEKREQVKSFFEGLL